MSSRTSIVNAIVTKFKEINGAAPYTSNLFTNVSGTLKFWDEVADFPTVCVTAGDEIRDYLPGDFKWGFLTINVRIYVKGDDASQQVENIFEDIEYVIDNNNELEYEIGKFTTDLRIMRISSDEGLLLPQGVGELSFQVRYAVD